MFTRRKFLQYVLGGSAVVASGVVLAGIEPSITPLLPKRYKHYPAAIDGKLVADMSPENAAIRLESHQMVENFKTPKEYGMIFKSAHELWLNKNCCEAMYRARIASRRLPKGWMPPKEVMLLSTLLMEYGVRYNEKGFQHPNECRYV